MEWLLSELGLGLGLGVKVKGCVYAILIAYDASTANNKVLCDAFVCHIK